MPPRQGGETPLGRSSRASFVARTAPIRALLLLLGLISLRERPTRC